MTLPFICEKCGTIYSHGAVVTDKSEISDMKCKVCGGTIQQRNSSIDPTPSRKGDVWLWLFAFPWELIILFAFVTCAITLWFKFK